MGKQYDNIEELKQDFGYLKAYKILEIKEDLFELEKVLELQTGGTDEELLDDLQETFLRELEEERKQLEVLPLKQEKQELIQLFRRMIETEREFDSFEDYHEENFSQEKFIADYMNEFFFESALDFLYMKGNKIAESIKEEARELIPHIDFFVNDNFYFEEAEKVS